MHYRFTQNKKVDGMQICKHRKELLTGSQQFQEFWFVNSLTKHEVSWSLNLIQPAMSMSSADSSLSAGAITIPGGIPTSQPWKCIFVESSNKIESKVTLPQKPHLPFVVSSLCSVGPFFLSVGWEISTATPIWNFTWCQWCDVDASCIMRLLTFKTLQTKIAFIT